MAAVSIQRDTDLVIGDYTDSLRRHLRARLGCESDVEDLAQEACLKFLQAARRGIEIQNPKAYLMTIAHNLLYHHYKARTRSIVSSDVDVDTLHVLYRHYVARGRRPAATDQTVFSAIPIISAISRRE